ncbi:hypothetical protein CPB97_001047 [Podila verticillata]|nr:hypothetical protein CPB97_001047 [Podila verticillata]
METKSSSNASESACQFQTMKKRLSHDTLKPKSASPSPSPTPALVTSSDPQQAHSPLPAKQLECEVESAVELTAVAVAPSEDVSLSEGVPPTKIAQIAMSEPPQWQKVIEASVKAVVSIRYSQVAAFDTEGAGMMQASGFVVDAEKGIVLTNRHVTCSGPFLGEAIFHDHEEVEVHAIYRDPVHDFGFLRFDKSKIKYMDVVSIPLAPELAKVGIDIRIVGNDAGEKLSILSGSISRLDRNAPVYADLSYNDFNTFYLQAAASASGGSSGSPVFDINGNAVALQAGGNTSSATDFFLPLDRIKRALEYIRNDEPVPRGTIQTQFLYRPFDETRRLGLSQETESMIRSTFPDEIGMLVAEKVLPKGPGCQFLEEGDVLVSVNGELITKFVPLEDCLDRNVGKEIEIVTERGGERRVFKVTVQDLHSITPDRFVQIGGTQVNQLSYQLARAFCVPVEGVYVSCAMGMFRLDGHGSGYIIKSIDNHPILTLDDFIRVLSAIPDRERIPVVHYRINDIHTTSITIVQMERHWTPFRMAVRNDKTGLWDFTDLAPPIPPKAIVPSTARFLELDKSLGQAKQLFHSMVDVAFRMPQRLDGFPRSRKYGSGLVLDAVRGLVVVSRNIVPFAMGDLNITVAHSVIIPGKVVYLHPTHNFTIISYDPAHIGDTPLQSAEISPIEPVQGHRVSLVAFNSNHRPVCVETVITDITSVAIPQNYAPRFRSINFDSITVDTPQAHSCSSGVLADSAGRVQALWLSYMGHRSNTSGSDTEYHLGLSISTILPVLKPLQQGLYPKLRSLNIELAPVLMSKARHMGLSDTWVKRVEAANPARQQIYIVRRTEAGSLSATILKELDLILSINGQVITRIQELDVQYEAESLEMVVLRNKEELTLTVPTEAVDGNGTSRIVWWAGAMLHEPHKAVLQQSKQVPSRVYISLRSYGSPSYMYGMASMMWVTHINGTPTPDLDSFLGAVRQCPDNTYVRVKIMSFEMVPSVLSVKTNMHYWPTSEMTKDDTQESGWRTVEYLPLERVSSSASVATIAQELDVKNEEKLIEKLDVLESTKLEQLQSGIAV